MAVKVLWYTKEFLESIDSEVKKYITRQVYRFERILQELFRGPKSGRTYKVSSSGALHQASAPGEAPAILSGRLRQSITHVITRTGPAEYTAEVGSDVEYLAGFDDDAGLEFGTSQMEARPSFRPALAKLAKENSR